MVRVYRNNSNSLHTKQPDSHRKAHNVQWCSDLIRQVLGIVPSFANEHAEDVFGIATIHCVNAKQIIRFFALCIVLYPPQRFSLSLFFIEKYLFFSSFLSDFFLFMNSVTYIDST